MINNKNTVRCILALFLTVLFVPLIASCGKPKEGKLVVSEQEFSMRKDKENSWVIDAKGKVKNVGEVDVKNVVVTGYCRSCGEVFTNGAWYISEYEKTPDQKNIISYLPAGAEEAFSFTGVAFMFDFNGVGPDKLPEVVECVIFSFEPVEK